MISRKYWLETYGCQMNKAESNALEIALGKRGWTAAVDADEADFVILNTCSVRKTAENRIQGRIGYYRAQKEHRPFALAVMGCMAENIRQNLKESAPGVDLLVGTFQKEAFVSFLDELDGRTVGESPGSLAEDAEYRFQKFHWGENEFKSFVPIMHGCDNFCSYCIVPYVRGREVSRAPEDVFSEIDELDGKGVKEITLLGQNVNSYRFRRGKEDIVHFPDLLESIADRVRAIGWIRFLTSHPKDLSERLLETMSGNPLFCRHIHLPVQHGSDRILAAMNRKYTASRYLRLVETIRSYLPGASITTDLLIGFPGETEEDLERTFELIREVGFEDAFTYQYNPREGTEAFALGDTVPEEVKLERLSRIIELQREIAHTRKLLRVGAEVKVLVENVSKKNGDELLARTEHDEMVVFPGLSGSIGGFSTVQLLSLSGQTFRAREVT